MKIITDKYHTILRKKTLLCDLSTRNITIAYLLAYYLGSSCEKYNNEIDLETYLDKYYGIHYNVSLSKVGNKI